MQRQDHGNERATCPAEPVAFWMVSYLTNALRLPLEPYGARFPR
jgi:hypothetical protein